jgi:hypothetical protein
MIPRTPTILSNFAMDLLELDRTVGLRFKRLAGRKGGGNGEYAGEDNWHG